MLHVYAYEAYKAETAVHGCHYLGQEPIGLLPEWYGCAYARPWVGVSLTFIIRKELPFLQIVSTVCQLP